MPTDRTVRLMAEAADPTTPVERMMKLANTVNDARVQRALKRNPSLPDVWYLNLLSAGDEDAWCNPQFALVYLGAPTSGAVVEGALTLVRSPVRDPANIPVLRENVGPVLATWWATTNLGADMAKHVGGLVRTPSHRNNTEAPRRMVEAGAALVREMLPRAGGWQGVVENHLATVDRWLRGEQVNMAQLDERLEATVSVVRRPEDLVMQALRSVVDGAVSQSQNAASNAAFYLLTCEEKSEGDPSRLNARFAQVLRQHFPRCPVPMWLEEAGLRSLAQASLGHEVRLLHEGFPLPLARLDQLVRIVVVFAQRVGAQRRWWA